MAYIKRTYLKKKIAGTAARRKSRQVYRTNIRLPKKTVVKKFANFVGKSTYKKVKSKRKTTRSYTRRKTYRRTRSYRKTRRY